MTLQGTLFLDTPVHDPVGFEIGWEHARHALPPPAHLRPEGPVRQGYEAGRASFGRRTRALTPAVQAWLGLRLQALQHGCAFDTQQVTPAYLRRLLVEHCPITREILTQDSGRCSDASIGRACNDVGYVAGNLLALSTGANRAKGALAWDGACERLQRAAQARLASLDGLSAAQWQRVATLLSFVTPLAHEAAARLPLRLLPPQQLHLLNPVQGLQALLTLQLMHPQWAQRLSRIEALFEAGPLRRDYQLFIHTLIPRLLACSQRDAPPQRRWALEDAWQHEALNRRWQRLALQLDATACSALVDRLVARGLAPQGAADGALRMNAPVMGGRSRTEPAQKRRLNRAVTAFSP